MKKIRYLFEALFLLIILMISKILPVTTASNFGGFIGRTIGPRLAASRKAERNIRNIMTDKNDDQIKSIVTGMWENLGRVIMEYPHLDHICRDRLTFIGADKFPDDRDQPIMTFSGHLANWEVMPGALLHHANFPVHSIYRAPNNPISDYLLMKARTRKNNLKNIPKSKSGTREIVQSIKNNRNIGMLVDQKYNEGIEIDFLGKPAMTSPIFAQLAKKYNCPLYPVSVKRLNGPNFEVTLHDPLRIDDKTNEQIVAESHEYLKTWIFENPEQWLWLHNRWIGKNRRLRKNQKAKIK